MPGVSVPVILVTPRGESAGVSLPPQGRRQAGRSEPRSNNAIAAGLSPFGPSHHQKLDLARTQKSKPTGKMRPKDRPFTNDFVSDEAFAGMLRAWFANASRVPLHIA